MEPIQRRMKSDSCEFYVGLIAKFCAANFEFQTLKSARTPFLIQIRRNHSINGNVRDWILFKAHCEKL